MSSGCNGKCGLCGGCADIEESAIVGDPTQFHYAAMFQEATERAVTWRKLEGDYVEVLHVGGRKVLQVKPAALVRLAHEAMVDIQHFFRHDHLSGWRRILDDPEATENDKFVALQLLKNACIAADKVLPACQDTGTAIVMGKRGELVWTGGEDEKELAKGIWAAYTQHNLRYSQCAPSDMFQEVNTRTNLPAQFDILATKGSEYKFLFVAKGGGSANKTFLYQMTKALLNPKSLRAFIAEKLKSLGTSACPPYHLALVIGGTSAELTMKTVKLASCRYLDNLPTSGDATGRAFRDLEWERIVLDIAQSNGVGAQFGGKYFAHQARVIRLPRHGASCPVGLGVSCSADRQAVAQITEDGVFLEQLVYNPSQYLPGTDGTGLAEHVVKIDLNQPMSSIRDTLSQHEVKTRLSLTGTLVVARDIAHAKILERIEAGGEMPQYLKDHIVYYAGPAKTPDGMASGSFGPTTAGRMDSYVDKFMSCGGSFISLAKGNRSQAVCDACKKYKGFYLGSIGGPAAILATNHIRKMEVIEFPELGMEAVYRIEVEDFPAFIVVDDKGNDFYAAMLQ